MTPDVSSRRAVQFGGLGFAVKLGRDVVPNEPSCRGALLSSPAVSCSWCCCLGCEGSTSPWAYFSVPTPSLFPLLWGEVPCQFSAAPKFQTKAAFLESGSWGKAGYLLQRGVGPVGACL